MKKKFIVTILSLLVMCSLFNVNVGAIETFTPGVNVTVNEDDEYPAKYTANFVYCDDDYSNIEKVEVFGGFQFYLDGSNTYYNAFEYQDGMYPGGYEYDTSSYTSYEMESITDGIYSLTLPLPANQYFYKYRITYKTGEVKEIKDPNNLPLTNGGDDANWSLFYVGDKENASIGQEYIYPRNDKKGSLSFVEYESIDGSMQPLGIYLPNNYDRTKTYKTIYVSHGAFGNEVEWMTIGSIPNIMDNLIAEGKTKDAIVVTMDNWYFGFDNEKTVKNLTECIIPFVENHYSVSTNKDDRAMCGLSAGGTVTSNVITYANSSFGYYGVWSPRDTVLENAINTGAVNEDIYKTFNDAVYYIGVGNHDLDIRKEAEESLQKVLTETVKADSTLEYVKGTHDWYVWRNLFANFVSDYLWSMDSNNNLYTGGFVVNKNTDKKYEADYAVTFTYLASKEVKSVNLVGGFQFYSKSDADTYMKTLDPATVSSKSVYEYKKGMFASGYDIATGQSLAYPMDRVDNYVYSVTLPLPANEYYYGYEITYKDGTVETIEDPANPSIKNGENNPTWSYVFVGNSSDCQEGQEYIYPRTDGKKGTYTFAQCDGYNGTKQPLCIYVPANYDKNKTYKTIYLSHGAGGNETEWFQLGAASNIMDNLIAENLTDEAIVVTMNNAYFNDTFNWDWQGTADNIVNNIIPYIEANYSVSKKAEDRAMCGLSNGSRLASQVLYSHAKDFGYIGMFSRALTEVDLTKCEGIKDTEIYFSIGTMEYNSAIDTWKQMMKDAGISYTYQEIDAAHDWNMWRASFTTFVKDICWSKQDVTDGIVDNPVNNQVNNQENSQSTASAYVKTGDDVSALGLLIIFMSSGYVALKLIKKYELN